MSKLLQRQHSAASTATPAQHQQGAHCRAAAWTHLLGPEEEHEEDWRHLHIHSGVGSWLSLEDGSRMHPVTCSATGSRLLLAIILLMLQLYHHT